MKFTKIEVLLTDDQGYLTLKNMLPDGSIVWSRSVEGKVAVKLKDEIDLDYIEKHFNSLHRTLNL